MAEDEQDENWRFELDDLDDEATESSSADATETDDGGSAAEEQVERPPLEPGSPSLENALFVLFGVALTLFVFLRVLAIIGG
jgi:hypothetical protein